jgi:hypothetical protein
MTVWPGTGSSFSPSIVIDHLGIELTGSAKTRRVIEPSETQGETLVSVTRHRAGSIAVGVEDEREQH